MNTVAREIRRARLRAKLSQAALAKRAGMKQQQIARLESAAARPTLRTLQRIAAALGMRLVLKWEHATGTKGKVTLAG